MDLRENPLGESAWRSILRQGRIPRVTTLLISRHDVKDDTLALLRRRCDRLDVTGRRTQAVGYASGR